MIGLIELFYKRYRCKDMGIGCCREKKIKCFCCNNRKCPDYYKEYHMNTEELARDLGLRSW